MGDSWGRPGAGRLWPLVWSLAWATFEAWGWGLSLLLLPCACGPSREPREASFLPGQQLRPKLSGELLGKE